MCRWVAYAGQNVFLEDVLFQQQNSLISQSLKARQSIQTTNGDGFGLAWYGQRTEPGIFKDILPAWNDENLRSLCGQIESRLFFAHVRAATGTSVSRANCHPYRFENWVFMHNGRIGNWMEHRREIESQISHDYYPHRLGTTDSEALFLLALSEGLSDDPQTGMAKAIAKVQKVLETAGEHEPLRISAALSDGHRVWAFRYSSDHQSPSLYYGWPDTHGRDKPAAGVVNTIASEPIDDDQAHWTAVGESHQLVWDNGKIKETAFAP